MKRKIALVFVAAMAASILAGCGGTDGESAANKDSGKKVVLTFGTHQSGIPSCGVVQELAEKYEEETGIKIDFQISPDAQWRDLLKVKLDSAEAPDIYCVDSDALSLYSRVRPDDNAVDLSGEEYVDRMADYAKECVTYDGKVYGIRFAEPKINFYNYNKKIFADLNLEPPTTYEELKQVCQTIQDAGITPIFEATQSSWHQAVPLCVTGAYYESKDPGLYDALNDNKKDIKDVDTMLTVLEQMNEFAELGFYGEDYLSNTAESDKTEMGEGRVAMTIASQGFGAIVAENYPEMEGQIGIFQIPYGDSDVLGLNPSSAAYFVNSKGEHVEEALEFFRFLARPENLQYRQDNNPEEMGLCWPEIEPEYPEEITEYINSLKQGTVLQVGVKYIDPQFMDIGKDIEAMYTGALTPEQVMENISNRRIEQAKLQKDKAWE